MLLEMIDRPASDVLNAAQSGGVASNLQHELDYLIPGTLFYAGAFTVFSSLIVCLNMPAMLTLPGGNFFSDWKLITIQIGSKTFFVGFCIHLVKI